MEVNYIRIGDMAERLDVPQSTLRNWVNQLEKRKIHYVNRNNRNERVFTDEDIKVFTYLRDSRKEFSGLVTDDLGRILIEQDAKGNINLRTVEQFPEGEQKNDRVAELLNNEDIQKLMESDRVKQLMSAVMQGMKDDLSREIKDQYERVAKEENAKLMEQMQDRFEEMQKGQTERDKKMDMAISDIREEMKQKEEKKKGGFFSKLFGK
jgi:DNA-binding transcriptional MerR regulator